MHKPETPKRTWSPAWAGIIGWLLIIAAVILAAQLPWPAILMVAGLLAATHAGAALIRSQIASRGTDQ